MMDPDRSGRAQHDPQRQAAPRAASPATADAGAARGAPPNDADAGAPQPGTAQALLPALTLPKGGGAIRGIGEKFQVNAATGTASLGVPLPISPGRSGFGPAIELSYDSGAGNGPFGLGFALSVPAITRKTDQGLPRYYDDAESDEYILSGAEDLVPVRDPGTGALVEIDSGEHVARRYRPRVEGLFARIERWIHRDTRDVHWRVTTPDNTTHVYGTSAASRIADPKDPARVFSFLLEESRDDKGNVVRYEYKAEDGAGVDRARPSERTRFEGGTFAATAQRYLKRALYCNAVPFVANDFLMEVVFDYGEHAAQPLPDDAGIWPVRVDPSSSYRATFEVRTYRLCQRVLMFHRLSAARAPVLVRSARFTYEPGAAFTYLVAVTHAGHLFENGAWQARELPTLRLDYTRFALDDQLRLLPRESLEGLQGGVDGSRKQWVDLDGEGIPGVLIDADTAWYYKQNRGGGRLDPPRALATMPASANLSGGVRQLEDLGGDGQLDLIAYESPLSGYFSRTVEGTFETLRPSASVPNIDFDDPNLRFIDLDGDGHGDLLITEDHAFVWYRSKAKGGFEPAERVAIPFDEDRGPAVVFADPEQSIQLADMSGDGLVDIVRVRNGEVCYWPNLGHGRFGAKITLEASPRFTVPEEFDARRVRFGDVDGSGTSDLFYAGRDVITLYRNESGNRLGPAQPIRALPPVDSSTQLGIVDLLGQGTACLVWSSPLPSATAPVIYVDLTGGVKPHLLRSVLNNLGAETHIEYAPSTRFYLADKAAGRPWLTRLAFPVQVVARLERHDAISKSRLVSTYSYHHGYFDGAEREFRGFGRVEQRDAESFSIGDPNTELDQPPTRVVSWYHTGAWLEKERLELALAKEYHQEGPSALLLPDTVFDSLPLGTPFTIQDQREAARALRGSMLRQEIYAEDGTPRSENPYVITEQSFAVRRLQSSSAGKHGVFLTYPRESLAIHTERNPADPRIAHDFVLRVDDFGNVTRKASVTYPRQPVGARLPEQEKAWATLSEAEFINHPAPIDPSNAVPSDHWHRLGVPFETRSYELTGLPALGAASIYTFAVIDRAIDALLANLTPSNDLPYEDTSLPGTFLRRRLLDRQQQLFYRDDLTGPLPLGQLESLALPYESYQVALTPGLVTHIADQSSLLTGVSASPSALGALLVDEGSYVQRDSLYWAASGRVIFDATRFYVPIESIDPFGAHFFVTHDDFTLLVTSTRDPFGNVVSAENDYRVLAPWRITDVNLNRTEVAFDALGMLVRTAVMGKSTESLGDTLENPTTELQYDLLRWQREQKPVFVHTIAREEHFSDNSASRFQHSFAYSDGFGRAVMQKVQAEPGEVPGVPGAVNPRWVGTGRAVFNNKGNPVKQYEPFFSATSDFEDETAVVQTGVTPIIHYDPLDRVVRTELPDGSESRVEFDAWVQCSFDANDAVAGTRWLSEHQAGTADQQRAATLALAHANTPTITHLDTLGRPFLVQADNGPDPVSPAGPHRLYDTRSVLDIEGNVLALVDARGITTILQRFDVLGRRFRVQSPDAGTRLAVADVAGKPLRSWDARAQTMRSRCDVLQRQTHLYVRQGTADERLLIRTVFGEALDPTEARRLNLRGAPYQLYDCAGLVTNARFDFKGNLLEGTRRVAVAYETEPDWIAAENETVPSAILAASESQLEGPSGTFTTRTAYDALNRVRAHTTPDGSVTRPAYNEAGLLEQIRVSVRGGPERLVINNIDYNARGQRVLCEYVNPTDEAASVITSTTYEYDPKTFRLTELLTRRGSTKLQHLLYTYDPVGNIVALRNQADDGPFFNGNVVSGDGLYLYDALYRLIEATGREHPGTEPVAFEPPPGAALPHPNDTQALSRYTETYRYDPVGNIEQIQHTGSNGWTRNYQYFPDSNRLRFTSVPGNPLNVSASYTYDAHGSMTSMPHLPLMDWDYADRLKHTSKANGDVQETYFTYDAAGQRVRKVFVTAGTIKERIYLGGYEVYRERANTSNSTLDLERQTLHVMDDQRRIALVETKTREDGSDVVPPVSLWRFQLDNHLGSAMLELDHAGSVISYEEYHSYGSTAFQSAKPGVEVSAKRYRYTGKERDEETGLYYHGARYYAPWLGRWTAADPAGVTDGLNLYRYSRNNPVSFSDPGGTQSKPFAQPGSVDYQVGTSTDAQLYGSLKSMSPEQRGNFASGATGAFKQRVQAFLNRYDLATSVTIPEVIIQGSRALPMRPSASAAHEFRPMDAPGMSTLDKVQLAASIAFPPLALSFAGTRAAVTQLVEDVQALASGPEERQFLGENGRVVSVTVQPDPGRKAIALGNLGLAALPAGAAARARGAAARGAADAVEGLPAGKLYGDRRLDVLRKHLEKRGVQLDVGDEFLRRGQGGGFAVRPDGSARMVLPSNPTEYVVTHELGHYVHWRGVGTDAYLKLPRTPQWNAPEQFVFDQLEKPMRWWRFSDAERQHAIDYIERVGFR